MDWKTLGIAPVAGISIQTHSVQEVQKKTQQEERKRSKRVKPKGKPRLWTPNQPMQDSLAGALQDFAQENAALFQSALRIASFAAKHRISDFSLQLPISIGVSADEAEKSALIGGDDEGLFMYLQVHLDHDLFGIGSVRILSDEEFELAFDAVSALPYFWASSEHEMLTILTTLGAERSHDLEVLREYICLDESGENLDAASTDLEEISDRLNQMLTDYHDSTDALGDRVLMLLEEKGATYEAGLNTDWRTIDQPVFSITEAGPHTTPQKILVKASEKGMRLKLTQKSFKIDSATDDDEAYPLLNEYRVADFRKGGYLLRAVRDLTLCGITVVTERTFNGRHESQKREQEGKILGVDVPALPYATHMSVVLANQVV